MAAFPRALVRGAGRRSGVLLLLVGAAGVSAQVLAPNPSPQFREASGAVSSPLPSHRAVKVAKGWVLEPLETPGSGDVAPPQGSRDAHRPGRFHALSAPGQATVLVDTEAVEPTAAARVSTQAYAVRVTNAGQQVLELPQAAAPNVSARSAGTRDTGTRKPRVVDVRNAEELAHAMSNPTQDVLYRVAK